MRIFDIEIYRDGGSLEFTIEKSGAFRHVWLETPFRGEPRALLVNSAAVSKNSFEVRELLADIEEWWCQLPLTTQLRVQEVQKHKGPYYNASAEVSEAINLSRVLAVRDYALVNYGA